MANFPVTDILSVASLLVLIFLIVYTLGFFFLRSKMGGAIKFFGKHSILFSFLISVCAVVGSLIYSEGIGYEPCVLCWVQRIFLYPQAIMFFLALYWKDYRVWLYTLPLSVLGGIVALYHAWTQVFGGSLLPCTAEGAACSKVFFIEYGFITIPAMAAITFLFLIFLAVHMRYYSLRS